MAHDRKESLGFYDEQLQLIRYGSEDMKSLFTKTSFLKYYLLVEKALLIGLVEAGIAKKECIDYFDDCSKGITVEEWVNAERRYGHELAALTFLLGEKCSRCASYIHLGATSNDIIDTGWALIFRDAIAILKSRLKSVIIKLISMSEEYRNVIMAGRTHGQHALPITFGFKLANYVYELTRSYERLLDCEKRLIRGKIGGAVGTKAAWRDKGIIVEEAALRYLKLEPHSITTQIAPRDGFAEFISILAILASQLDRLSLEIRELSRTEIDELSEGFERIGSSTMPHKKNPVVSERISGLAKVMRALSITALENIPTMHERDLTNSSSERTMIPLALIIIDQMLIDMLDVLRNLVVNEDKMRENLSITGKAILSEALMVELALRGMARHKAYEKVKKAIERAIKGKTCYTEVLLRDNEIGKMISEKEVNDILRYENYLGVYESLIRRAIEYSKRVLERS